MKRWMWGVLAVGALLLSGGSARASWGSLTYSGYQPWWNLFAKRYKCLTPEEARLQKFWHDYYHALKEYYCDLDHIDWVAYYKNHGYQINGGCGPCGGGGCCQRINYAPVVVAPNMVWAIPSQSVVQPAACPPPGYPGCGPMGCGPMGCGPMGPPPGYPVAGPGMPGPMMAGPGMPGPMMPGQPVAGIPTGATPMPMSPGPGN